MIYKMQTEITVRLRLYGDFFALRAPKKDEAPVPFDTRTLSCYELCIKKRGENIYVNPLSRELVGEVCRSAYTLAVSAVSWMAFQIELQENF